MIDKTSTNSRCYLFRYVISIYLGFEMEHRLNTKNPIFPIRTNDLTKAKSGKSENSDGFRGRGGPGRGGGWLEGHYALV